MVYFNVNLIYYKEIVCTKGDNIKIGDKIRQKINIVVSVICLKTLLLFTFEWMNEWMINKFSFKI